MKLIALCSLITVSISSYGQINLIIPANIILPTDSLIKIKLINSLNGFLNQKEKPVEENSFVLKEDLLETSLLLDEIKGSEKSNKYKSNNFYKAYLTNVVQLSTNEFLIQAAYIGINDNLPMLRTSFEVIAKPKNNQFYFHSPLKQNIINWKIKKIGNTAFYFKNTFNTSNAKKYLNKIEEYDKKLNASDQLTEFYCCDNFPEALQLIGIDYKSDYNGYSHNSLITQINKVNLVINGTLTSNFTKFDPHDLWHDRLHQVLSIDTINRPVDEGCAYLYGGSWGLSWKEILEKFKIFAAANQKADWITLYNDSKNFDEKATYPLRVDFVINALLVQKIEKEKGFLSVIELLSCGKKEKENENYFNALKKITGIDKPDFNAAVWALIKLK